MSETESTSPRAGIVVGFDGSPDARAALEWAIREAASRHEHLRVVHAEPDLAGWDAAAMTAPGTPPVPPPGVSGPILEAAAELAKQSGVDVSTLSLQGGAASVLVEQSKHARTVVIGSRGMSSVASAVLGSTVSHVASHARCPVVVVQSGGNPAGPVIVGVDGSAESEETLAWAFDYASRHGLPLEVLHAYAIPVYPGVVPYVPPVEITRATSDFEERVTGEALAGWSEGYPDVQVSSRVIHGRPGPALIEASEHGCVTVVGSHGRGAFLGMLLGSTSQSLLHHAKGSVVVVRHRH